MKRFCALMAGLLLSILLLTACSGGSDTITVGSKDFSENIVVGEMLAQLIEAKTDLKVDRKLNMGGTFICFEALKNGDIDVYLEYTGTGLTAQLKRDVISDPEETYAVVKQEFNDQFNIAWLSPLGFNNTYAIAVPAALAEQYSLETTSDLAAVAGELTFGAEHEFFNRQDGYDGFVDTYGITFREEPKKMNVSIKYQAIGNGDMDVTDAYATDGQIVQYNLKLLKDDKSFFPPYYAAPVVRNETLEKHPELAPVLDMLAGLVDDAAMTELNYKIDVEKNEIEDVARDFLTQKGLIG